MENIEIWKDIPDYEDYQVSNLGRVKSFKKGKEIILKQCKNTVGYYMVNLCKYCEEKNKSSNKSLQVHQLVAIAFLGHKPCGYKLVVNHKDFNRLNNNVDNLEIVTSRENTSQKHLKSTSKYVGVCWDKKRKKWKSTIYFKNTPKHLGFFDLELDAHLAYQKELKKIIIK